MPAAVTSHVIAPEMDKRQDGTPVVPLVAIAGSAGGIEAMRDIISRLPALFPAPILCLQHLSTSHCSTLVDVLQSQTPLRVRWAQQGDRLAPGVVYISPPGHSVVVRPDGTLVLTPIATRLDGLHAADLFFASVAASYGHRAVVIVLSGVGWDGTEGVCAVHERRGTVLVQDKACAFIWGMPKAALATGCVDAVLPPQEIAPVLVNLVRDGYSNGNLRAIVARFVDRRLVAVTPALHTELRNLLAMTVVVQGTDLGNIQLLDRETGTLGIVVQRGFGIDFLQYFATVSSQDDSACGRAMRDGESVLIADVNTDPLFVAHRGIAASAGFRSVQSTPLISRGGALLGILSTHFRTARHRSPGELRAIQLHARRAADIIERLSTA